MARKSSGKARDASPHASEIKDEPAVRPCHAQKLISISLKILLALVVLIAVVATFYESMTFFDHDEQMYVPAAWQIMQGKSIYRDFAFNQTPYVPLVFAAAIKISGTHHYFLTGKLINFLLWIVSAAIFYMSARRFSGDTFLAACLLLLYLFDFYVTRVSIVATNYNIPITFAILGSYLMLTASDGGNQMRLLVAGLCMTVAVGAKLLYLPLLLPFGLAVFYPACTTNPHGGALRRFWPLALGMGLGLLLAFYYFFRDPSGFIFHNVQYHIINIEWRKQTGNYELLDLASKFWWVLGLFKSSNYLVLLLWLVFDFLLLIGARRRFRAMICDFPVAFLACSTLIAVAVACFPRPLWPQYFAIPIPYWLLLIAAMHGRLHRPLRTMNRRLAFAAVLTVLALTLPQKFQKLTVSLARSPQTWPVVVIHRNAQEIRALLEQAGLQGKIATLSPLTPLEADLPVYPELATGFLYYRIGDFLSAREHDLYHIVSPRDINGLLEADPPAAILTGLEGDLDDALIRFAEIHHYKKVAEISVEILYLRTTNGGNS